MLILYFQKCKGYKMYISEKAKELAKDYWNLINDLMIMSEKFKTETEFDIKYQSFYGLDNRRTEFHDELCKELNIEKDEIKYITDNLDRYDCFERFLEALEKHIKKPYNEPNQVRRNFESVIRRIRYK